MSEKKSHTKKADGTLFVVELDDWLAAVGRMVVRRQKPEIFLQDDLVLHGYQPLCGLALQKMHDIYSADPDIVGIYYNLGRKIESRKFEDEADEYASKALYEVAKEYVEKAKRNNKI